MQHTTYTESDIAEKYAALLAPKGYSSVTMAQNGQFGHPVFRSWLRLCMGLQKLGDSKY
jgi:hypothetical protein